jgi:hypothetical protein
MRFAVVLFLAFVIGCGGKTPTAPGSAFLRFTPRSPEPGSAESARADAGQGQITVHATLAGPDPCRTLAGELEQAVGQLILRVSIRPTGGPCILIVGRFAYDASIEGLVRGRYSLQVVHTYSSTGWPANTVLNETLDVR